MTTAGNSAASFPVAEVFLLEFEKQENGLTLLADCFLGKF